MRQVKPLNGFMKDVGTLTIGSLAVGVGAKAVEPLGGNYGAGLSAASGFLPVMGTLVGAKATVGLLSSAARMVPSPPRRRR